MVEVSLVSRARVRPVQEASDSSEAVRTAVTLSVIAVTLSATAVTPEYTTAAQTCTKVEEIFFATSTGI